MGPFDRALLAIYTFFISLVFILFSAVMLGWPEPLGFLRDLFYPGTPQVFWPVMAFLILAGARLFRVSLARSQKGRYVVLAESAMGQVRVSLTAIQNLVDKVVGQISGVREVKSRIVQVPQGVGIQVRVEVTPDVSVPSLSGDIQCLVKERVLEVTGISVNSVRVLVENITAQKPRVE